MRDYLIMLMRSLEALIAPPKNCHHALTYAQYGNDAEGWSDRLAVQVNQGGIWRTLFLDDGDFERNAESLAAEIAAMLQTPPRPREQIAVGLGQYLL